MALKFMYITNDEEVAKIADKYGVDFLFVDLETRGKQERQGHVDSVKSQHSFEDIGKIKKVLNNSQLLVRINPFYEETEYEVERAIKEGTDIIMLPYFHTKEEVEAFVSMVNNRAKVCLLLESKKAEENIDEILEVDGIDCIHIGLNDLHLDYNLDFMFEVLANGKVEKLCQKIKEKNIPYGFGGIARVGEGHLPAEKIIAEHYRLGSEMVILARSFCNTNEIKDLDEIEELFKSGIKDIKDYEEELKKKDENFFLENQEEVKIKVKEIANILKEKKLEKVK